MSGIRGVDLQVLLPRASEASRVQRAQEQQGNLQTQFVVQFQQELEKKRQRVDLPPQAEKARITEKEEKGRRRGAEGEGEEENQQNRTAEASAGAASETGGERRPPKPITEMGKGAHLDLKV